MLNANDRGTTFCLVIAILTIWDLPHRKSRGIRMLYKSKNLHTEALLCHQRRNREFARRICLDKGGARTRADWRPFGQQRQD